MFYSFKSVCVCQCLPSGALLCSPTTGTCSDPVSEALLGWVGCGTKVWRHKVLTLFYTKTTNSVGRPPWNDTVVWLCQGFSARERVRCLESQVTVSPCRRNEWVRWNSDSYCRQVYLNTRVEGSTLLFKHVIIHLLFILPLSSLKVISVK